jgi:hypothetical protein
VTVRRARVRARTGAVAGSTRLTIHDDCSSRACPTPTQVIFHVSVREPTDRAMARVVAQELTEAYRSVGGAPPAAWNEREPPAELRGLEGVAPLDASAIGWVTFSLFASSYKTPAQRAAAAATLALFRDFLEYHLKAAKTYLHARMRRRAEDLQRVLNRAIPADANAERKTAGGKTFVDRGAVADAAAAAAAAGKAAAPHAHAHGHAHGAHHHHAHHKGGQHGN